MRYKDMHSNVVCLSASPSIVVYTFRLSSGSFVCNMFKYSVMDCMLPTRQNVGMLDTAPKPVADLA